MIPIYDNLNFKLIVEKEMDDIIVNFENRTFTKQFKFGVLLRCKGQNNELGMYKNNIHSEGYEEFLNFIGEKIELNGWDKYAAGLCTTDDSLDGTHSIYTEFKEYEIMFHVSSLISYDEKTLLQSKRKNYLGNDVILIIYDESKIPFDPQIISSQYNHVFFS